MKNAFRSLLVLFLTWGFAPLLLASGCSATTDRADDDGDDDGGAGSDTQDGGADSDTGGGTDTDTGTGDDGAGCDHIDLLFVIDNSESMTEEQESLAESFPEFIGVLDDYLNPAGEPITYRIGVTSTAVARTYTEKNGMMSLQAKTADLGSVENGLLLGQADCGLGANPWLEGPGPTVANDFSCMATLGIDGSTVEMPFAALELALGAKMAAGQPNEGFYVNDGSSLLVVVIITDEDDCSTTFTGSLTDLPDDSCASHPQNVQDTVYHLEPLQNYRDYLDGLFGGPERYVLVGIAGANSCDSSAASCSDDDDAYAGAKEAKRLKKFFAENADPVNSVFADLCTVDLPDALQEVLDKMTVACDELVIE